MIMTSCERFKEELAKPLNFKQYIYIKTLVCCIVNQCSAIKNKKVLIKLLKKKNSKITVANVIC